jgi:hypothetical protein
MNGRGQEYLDLLDIIQAQEKLDILKERLGEIADRLIERKAKIVLSPTDRPYETFEATDEIIWEK